MAAFARFSPREIKKVGEAFRVAEDSVSDFYKLSDTGWMRYPYELRTLAELRPNEVAHDALAQVLRLRKNAGGSRLREQDFFRICLMDHNLRSLVEREGDEGLFMPLLIYVLTHELIHVVRFYNFEHLFESTPERRAIEESKVHTITSRILSKARLPFLNRVITLYEDHCDMGAGLREPAQTTLEKDRNAYLRV